MTRPVCPKLQMIRINIQHVDRLWRSCKRSQSSGHKPASQRRTIVSGNTNGVPWFNSHCGSLFRYMPNTCWTVVPLGTSSAVPSPRRNVTATYLRMLSNGYLFDAGEGTFNQMRACYLCSLKSLRRVFITHMHGDHVFGLPSILMYSLELARTYSAMGRDMADLPRLQLFGPLGLYNYLRTAFIPAGRKGWESIPVDIFELVPQHFRGTLQHSSESKSPQGGGAKNHNYLFPDADGCYPLVDDDDHTVLAAPISHSISCYGYVVNEKERRHMVPSLAMSRGIPPGPIYSKLQKGISVPAPDGSVVSWEDVSFSSGVGRKVVILGDNSNADSIIPLAQNADLLTHECTVVDGDEAKALARGHSTAAMAGRMAAACHAKALLLTHFSSSYACSLRESSVHWLGRTEVAQQVRLGKSSTAPDHNILASNSAAASSGASGRLPSPSRLSANARRYGTATKDSLPVMQADESLLSLIPGEGAAACDMDIVEDYMPVGYTFYQAMMDGVFETDRSITDGRGSTVACRSTLNSNIHDLVEARLGGKRHRSIIQLSSCSFPSVTDVDSLNRQTALAASKLPHSKVVAARDFMAFPIEARSKLPPPDVMHMNVPQKLK